MAEGRAYCPNRLRRAATRAAVRLGPNQFRVRGTKARYWDVNLDLDTPCDCPDAQYRGRGCLHELKARMLNGDEGLLMELGMMLLRAEANQET